MFEYQLKIELSKELPKLIKIDIQPAFSPAWRAISQDCYITKFRWIDSDKEITDREWDWIVYTLVNSFREQDNSLWFDYGTALKEECGSFSNCISASWQQKAKVYFKVKRNRLK